MKDKMRKDRGVMQLNLLLAIVIFLFVIGFIIFIYGMIGGALEEESWTSTGNYTVNQTLPSVDEVGEFLAPWTKYNKVSCSISSVTNYTHTVGDGAGEIAAANYTISHSGCKIRYSYAIQNEDVNDTPWNVSYTWTAEQNNSASDAIYNSKIGLDGATDWFGVIIVLGAMVVLITLTVVIIITVRGSGLINIGGDSGATATA